ncbi:DUF1413 domain-containing protein [Staphylococcus equorum]|uniref:DUF1413 domain-containing protein n=1 Tax=Staphylococcus equorum TaxID=246432 RepID=UPI0018669D8B|nr:DUF1413 domain-containing protein [Staphylococcus equorum]
MATLNDVIKRAQKRKVNDGPFEIKELFSKTEWENTRNVKALGKAFYDAVDNKQVKNVSFECKKSDNHKVYKKHPTN